MAGWRCPRCPLSRRKVRVRHMVHSQGKTPRTGSSWICVHPLRFRRRRWSEPHSLQTRLLNRVDLLLRVTSPSRGPRAIGSLGAVWRCQLWPHRRWRQTERTAEIFRRNRKRQESKTAGNPVRCPACPVILAILPKAGVRHYPTGVPQHDKRWHRLCRSGESNRSEWAWTCSALAESPARWQNASGLGFFTRQPFFTWPAFFTPSGVASILAH